MKNKTPTSWAASRFVTPVIGALMLAAAPGHAASVSYTMDQSNALADGNAYMQVTIADGADGAIDFTVQVLDALSGLASERFGIQSFAFNVAPGGGAEGASVGNLPDGWITRDQYRMDPFGLFDIKLYGGGSSQLSTLTFSILGVEGDTPDTYSVLSTGIAPDGHQLFAARVADVQIPDCTNSHKCPSSVFIGGGTSSPVPLPATAWLFVTGAAAVAARARRRKSAA